MGGGLMARGPAQEIQANAKPHSAVASHLAAGAPKAPSERELERRRKKEEDAEKLRIAQEKLKSIRAHAVSKEMAALSPTAGGAASTQRTSPTGASGSPPVAGQSASPRAVSPAGHVADPAPLSS
jgi:hypothetical protein